MEKVNQQIEKFEKRVEFCRASGNMHKLRQTQDTLNKLKLEKEVLEKEAPLITIKNLEQTVK